MDGEDERWLVVDGRRWRRSDPGIPEPLRAVLVAELMAARRGVRAGEDDARARVHDAKVALGERGAPWWEHDVDAGPRVEATVRALLRHRAGRTICPSDVARVVGGDAWRAQMGLVRDVAAAMPDVDVLQRGEVVDAAGLKGPVRLALSPGGASPPAPARRTRRAAARRPAPDGRPGG